MNAKEYLRQYQDALVNIRNIEAELEELSAIAMSISVNTDAERVQTSGNQDSIGELVAKICDMQIELMDKRSDALDKMRRIEKTISQVENRTYRQILHMRYIENATWEKIAVALDRSYQWVCQLHGRALKAVEKLIGSAQGAAKF